MSNWKPTMTASVNNIFFDCAVIYFWTALYYTILCYSFVLLYRIERHWTPLSSELKLNNVMSWSLYQYCLSMQQKKPWYSHSSSHTICLIQVVHLLRALVTAKVQTREALLKKMKTTPDYLCEEIQQFLALEARKDFRRLWTALKGFTAW